jgi:RND family efflux transporter MFP subunit
MVRRLHVTGLAVVAAALAACHGGESASTAAPPAAKGERLLVREQSVPDLKPVAATVTSRNLAEARARIGGVLTNLDVKEGDAVRRGQQIGRVVDQRIGLETRAYDAQAAAAQAENVRAQAELVRIQDLYDHGVYAKARLDQAEAAAKAATGALNAARAQRAASAEGGAQGAILAPADGRVLHAQTPAGSVVTPGQSVATITAGETVVRVEVPEADAQGLAVGQTVRLVSEDLGEAITSASIVQVYPDVSAGKVTADLAAPGLKSELVGQRVRVRLQIGQRSAIVVPKRFILTRYGVDYARVAARDGSAADAPVQTAPGPQPDGVEILSGLNPGDVIVAPGSGQ